MNELKGFEPVAWQLKMPNELQARLFHHTKEQSVGAEHRWKEAYSGCKHEPLYPADQLAAVVQQRDELLVALVAMTDCYCSLVNSGDAGHWDCETEPVVIQSREAIAKVQP